MLGYFMIAPILVLVISIAFSFLYRKKKKKDKGFAFVYYRLSYRRKMTRTLWTLPVVLLILVVFTVFIEIDLREKILVWLFLLTLFFAQLSYNYYKWKKHEQEGIEAG